MDAKAKLIQHWLNNADKSLKHWADKQTKTNKIEPNFYYFNGAIDAYEHVLTLISGVEKPKKRSAHKT